MTLSTWRLKRGGGRSEESFRSSEITLRLVLTSHRVAVTMSSPLRRVSVDRRGGTRGPLITRSASRADRSHSPCNHARWTTANPPDGLPIPPSPGSGEYTPPFRNQRSDTTKRRSRDMAPSIFLKPVTATRHFRRGPIPHGVPQSNFSRRKITLRYAPFKSRPGTFCSLHFRLIYLDICSLQLYTTKLSGRGTVMSARMSPIFFEAPPPSPKNSIYQHSVLQKFHVQGRTRR